MPSRKRKECHALAFRIEQCALEMSPCSSCEKNDRRCLVAPGSSRCSECVRRGRKCDVVGPSDADWKLLQDEESRLEAEEEAAALAEQEAFARRMRIRRMQKLLKERGAEMLRRGLKTLDELDAAEEHERKETKEKEEAARRALLATSASSPGAVDASGNSLVNADVPFDAVVDWDALAALSSQDWRDLGAVGGTSPQEHHN